MTIERSRLMDYSNYGERVLSGRMYHVDWSRKGPATEIWQCADVTISVWQTSPLASLHSFCLLFWELICRLESSPNAVLRWSYASLVRIVLIFLWNILVAKIIIALSWRNSKQHTWSGYDRSVTKWCWRACDYLLCLRFCVMQHSCFVREFLAMLIL